MRTRRWMLAYAVFAIVLGVAGSAVAGGTVGIATALDKVRPGDPVPAVREARIEAAGNEFEAFQVVIDGGGAGVSGVTAEVTSLSGPGGATIDASAFTLYRVALYDVVVPSNTEGAEGPWPDPLVPDVDRYAGERRNAFPFDVPAGERRSIWVEVLVPPGTGAGTYVGTLTVQGDGLAAAEIPVELRVRGFDLPSTATLKSAFGMGWNAACVAHLGSYEACGDQGTEEFHVLYARAALDHRVSLESVVYYGPDGDDWTRFDGYYAPLFDGTADTRLAGARMTTVRLMTGDPAEMLLWHDHFQERGWLGMLFDYTCDEPPAGCSFDDIPWSASTVHDAGLRTLVTTDIDEMTNNGLLDDIDIAVPIVNYMEDRGGANRRPEYDDFLGMNASKELWWYQSCMSHGCGDGCVGTDDAYFTGWPSYMIDAAAIQNRAMEWLSFSYDIAGELYFETTYDLPSAWDDQCDFSGNGDGTLFYPGTPARIGGTTDIPIESIRLKAIRDGMEDYELLHLVATLGDEQMGKDEARALFPAPYRVTEASPDDLYAARTRLFDRAEELLGVGPPPGEDGGPIPGRDGGAQPGDDGGTVPGRDAGVDADAGSGTAGVEGDCGCRVGGRTGSALAGLGLALVLVLTSRRRRAKASRDRCGERPGA